MVVLRDHPYPIAGGSLEFDFFRPNGVGPYPLVVFLHGGGWISGDKTMFRDEAIWLTQFGFACACPSYRLSPLYPFPTPVSDCQAFLGYTRENSAQLEINPSRITCLGNSAGGHLALMTGLCPNHLTSGMPAVKANSVVSVCGITDLCSPEDSHFEISMSFIEQFMDGSFQGNEARWAEASPINYASIATGRYLLIHGTDDDVVPVDQSRKLNAALQSHGVDSRLVELPGELHSFTHLGWTRIRDEYLKFLQAE